MKRAQHATNVWEYVKLGILAPLVARHERECYSKHVPTSARGTLLKLGHVVPVPLFLIRSALPAAQCNVHYVVGLRTERTASLVYPAVVRTELFISMRSVRCHPTKNSRSQQDKVVNVLIIPHLLPIPTQSFAAKMLIFISYMHSHVFTCYRLVQAIARGTLGRRDSSEAQGSSTTVGEL